MRNLSLGLFLCLTFVSPCFGQKDPVQQQTERAKVTMTVLSFKPFANSNVSAQDPLKPTRFTKIEMTAKVQTDQSYQCDVVFTSEVRKPEYKGKKLTLFFAPEEAYVIIAMLHSKKGVTCHYDDTFSSGEIDSGMTMNSSIVRNPS